MFCTSIISIRTSVVSKYFGISTQTNIAHIVQVFVKVQKKACSLGVPPVKMLLCEDLKLSVVISILLTGTIIRPYQKLFLKTSLQLKLTSL